MKYVNWIKMCVHPYFTANTTLSAKTLFVKSLLDRHPFTKKSFSTPEMNA